MSTAFWGMTTGTDFTNYVAYVESSVYGGATPNFHLGAAKGWATNAQDHGVAVNQSPTVGWVAQWNANDPDINSDGHVAIVEQVGPNDSYVVVSQDDWSTDTGDYGWALIVADTPGREAWPDHFIHFPTTRLPTTLLHTARPSAPVHRQPLLDGEPDPGRHVAGQRLSRLQGQRARPGVDPVSGVPIGGYCGQLSSDQLRERRWYLVRLLRRQLRPMAAGRALSDGRRVPDQVHA
jgi:hypothetical protein